MYQFEDWSLGSVNFRDDKVTSIKALHPINGANYYDSIFREELGYLLLQYICMFCWSNRVNNAIESRWQARCWSSLTCREGISKWLHMRRSDALPLLLIEFVPWGMQVCMWWYVIGWIRAVISQVVRCTGGFGIGQLCVPLLSWAQGDLYVLVRSRSILRKPSANCLHGLEWRDPGGLSAALEPGRMQSDHEASVVVAMVVLRPEQCVGWHGREGGGCLKLLNLFEPLWIFCSWPQQRFRISL